MKTETVKLQSEARDAIEAYAWAIIKDNEADEVDIQLAREACEAIGDDGDLVDKLRRAERLASEGIDR